MKEKSKEKYWESWEWLKNRMKNVQKMPTVNVPIEQTASTICNDEH